MKTFLFVGLFWMNLFENKDHLGEPLKNYVESLDGVELVRLEKRKGLIK